MGVSRLYVDGTIKKLVDADVGLVEDLSGSNPLPSSPDYEFFHLGAQLEFGEEQGVTFLRIIIDNNGTKKGNC